MNLPNQKNLTLILRKLGLEKGLKKDPKGENVYRADGVDGPQEMEIK